MTSKTIRVGWTVHDEGEYLPFLVQQVDSNRVEVKIIGRGVANCIDVNTNETVDQVVNELYEGLHHIISPQKAAKLIAEETDFQPNKPLTVQLIHFLSSGPSGLVYVPRRFKSGEWYYVDHLKKTADGIIAEAGFGDPDVTAFKLAGKLIPDFYFRYLSGEFDE